MQFTWKAWFLYFRQYTIDYKLETYLKIAQLYLEDEDPINAEAYINRASIIQADTANVALQMLYKVWSSVPIISIF